MDVGVLFVAYAFTSGTCSAIKQFWITTGLKVMTVSGRTQLSKWIAAVVAAAIVLERSDTHPTFIRLANGLLA
jgi:hypothetical protein